jgi:hypothetical protein
MDILNDQSAGFEADVAGIITRNGWRRQHRRSECDRNGQLSHKLPLSNAF